MEQLKKFRKKYPVLGIQIDGLNQPPRTIQAYQLGRERVELVSILGGIFRMSPMSLITYFRWDERQAMGYGDATQFASLCQSSDIDMFRVATVRCSHGDSTNKQKGLSPSWDYEHDMLQYMPLGL